MPSILIVLVFAVIILLLTTMVVVMQVSAGYYDWLPISLHSLLNSDYSADPLGFKFAPVKLDLILEAIRDSIEDNSSMDSEERFATLQAGLSTPVASVTPAFSQTPFTPTSTPEKTDLPPSPSPTALLTQTATAEPSWLQPSPTFILWPTATTRPYTPPTQPPVQPNPTDPPPPPPTNPPPPPPTNPPPPPPPNPYPPAYP
ncbi:MAG: hypothetical protein MUO67_01970 [Anaerolineales bacterium]|nr:hypothetical protein [Anaerolineales bacterium]